MSHPETLALHGGSWRADPATGAVAPPIYQTTSFQFRDAEHARRLFALEELGYTYSRTINPGREVLERRLVALEGGKAALAVATGAAALLYAVLNLAEAGDNIVVPAAFAAARGQGLVQSLLRLGIDVRVVDGKAPEEFRHATSARTRAYVADSVSASDLVPFPLAAAAAIGRPLGVPLIVDNSLAPLSLRPLAEGAAVVVYDAAGPLGTGSANGGIIIDGGTFPWDAHPRQLPSLNRHDPSYHGTVWTEVVRQWNASPFIASARGRLLRDFGGAISPFDVVQIIQALETLPLRVRHRSEGAGFIARNLAVHPAVAEVRGPIGGRLAVRLRDNRPSSSAISRLQLLARNVEGNGMRAAVWSNSETSLVIDLGLEHPTDILDDLRQAFTGIGAESDRPNRQ